MPYKSAAQQRYFHYLESKGKMPKKTVEEFDRATDFEELPERVKKLAHGGMITDDMGYDFEDEDQGHYPVQEFEEEEFKRPMIMRMSRGGFARALKKAMY